MGDDLKRDQRGRGRSRSRDRHTNKRSRSIERYQRKKSRSRSKNRSRSPVRDRRRRDSSSSPRGRPSHFRNPSRSRSRSRSAGQYRRRSRSPPRYSARDGGGGRGGARGSMEPPGVGSIHKARVVSVRPFGAFVEIPGYKRHAMVHHSQVSEDVKFGREDDDEMKVKALEYFLPPGEQVWVKVTEVRPDGPHMRVAASMRAVSQDDGTDLDPDNLLAFRSEGPGGGDRSGGAGGRGGPLSDDPPELHTIHHGTIKHIKPFGVFVQLDGFRRYGLVHFSQISDHLHFTSDDNDQDRIAGIGEVVSEGEGVWVKVVEVGQDDRGVKIGCSIKVVGQREGEDLDPTNLRYKPREGGGAGGGGGHRMSAPIGAAAAVAHNAFVDWGHMKADVVQYGGGKQYELLAEDAQEGPPGSRPGGPPPPAAMEPRGRGRGNVLPAWMTSEGGGGGDPPAPGSKTDIQSVEEAVAILERYANKRSKKHKHKKDSKKKDKKHKKHKSSRKEKRHKRGESSEFSGSSSSDSD